MFVRNKNAGIMIKHNQITDKEKKKIVIPNNSHTKDTDYCERFRTLTTNVFKYFENFSVQYLISEI